MEFFKVGLVTARPVGWLLNIGLTKDLENILETLVINDVTSEATLPASTQTGARWSHVGGGYEYSRSGNPTRTAFDAVLALFAERLPSRA